MITLTIAELLNSADVLQKLSNLDLKAKLAWQVAKLIKTADNEIKDFNTARMDLIKKYGETDENGNLTTDEHGNCKIISDKISEFQSELNELISAQIELNMNKIQFEDLENLNFTPSEIVALEPFIDVEE